MNTLASLPTTPSTTGGITRRDSLLALCATALTLTGCGGGDGDGGTGVSSRTGFTVGPITGMGSIIVNGIRFDDSNARISDDDGERLRSSLKLGMLARVRSTDVTGTTGTATSVEVGGELRGRISGAPNPTARTFVVLGQTVRVTDSTVFDTSLADGFAALAADMVVEVHGLINPATNTLQATFIERKNSPNVFRLEGTISNLTPTQFTIGPIAINYSGAQIDDRLTLSPGTLVRVRLNAVLPPAPEPAVWTATRVRRPEDAEVEDRDEAEVKGIINAFTSTRSFSINGLPVNAANATFPQGETGVALGALVEVKGSISGGVLVASRVQVEAENEALEFELHGTISALSASSFTLTSTGGIVILVDFVVSTTVDNGLLSALANGRRVEIRGSATGSSTGSTRITATRIHFED